MSESKKTKAKKPVPKQVPVEQTVKSYTAEKLLKSKALAGYQQDFARIILTKPKYTVEEAKATLDEVLNKRNHKT